MRNNPSSIDYASLGLRVGLEIHRQLDTKTKLFCHCPTNLSQEQSSLKFQRRLRPTQSELGQIDPSALFEFHKGLTISYEADSQTTCLVELDEEPPHPLNPDAVDIALTISLLLKASTLDELHVMRKIVIDGSNTTGFQRTSVIGLDGSIHIDGKKVPIQQVTLEEDSARKTGEKRNSVTFRLDRLGVPLIEIATGPVITSPEEAGRVALAIGRLLRATRRVKRGLGSIRQDLNVSIRNGSLTEIKGVQELDLVAKAVEYEVKRQIGLLEIRDELKKRNVRRTILTDDLVDLTNILARSTSKIIQSSLKSSGGVVLAVKLRGFKGILGRELMPGIRFGTEMARRAIFYGHVGGLFHSDELPGYGITQEETSRIVQELNCGDQDGFIIVADLKDNATDALLAAVERAREATETVPEETRVANLDGTTQFMRPRPGAARMYPETDVPPVQIDAERVETLRLNLPKSTEQVAVEIQTRYQISPKLALQLADSEHLSTFERIVSAGKPPPSFVATVLTESMRSLSREGMPIENVSEASLIEIFQLVSGGTTAKESVVEIIGWLASNPRSSPNEALNALKLRMLPRHELEGIITKILESNKIQPGAPDTTGQVGKLMSLVMSQVRGRADPKLVNEILRQRMGNTR